MSRRPIPSRAISKRTRVLVAISAMSLAAGACTTAVSGTPTYQTGGVSADESGATASPSQGSAAPGGDPVDRWRRCLSMWPHRFRGTDCTDVIAPQLAGEEGSDRDLTFECGVQEVPINYVKPSGGTLAQLMVKVHLNSAGTDTKPLLVNPGGPGGSGANLAIGLGLSLPIEVLNSFDIIGFDPRGVGESEPLICLTDIQRDENAALSPFLETDEDKTAYEESVQALVDGCVDDYGDNLEHLNTVETARDMDQIRQALGEDQISYLGYSYGTQLGAVYATLFPDTIRAFVLDGAVDLQISDLESSEAQVAGFELAFTRFVDNCAANPSCPISADPRGQVEALLTATKDAPIPSVTDDREATDGITLTAVASALYSESEWPALASAIASAQTGDPTGLFELADSYNGRYTDENGDVFWNNLLDANAAVNCNDSTVVFTADEAQEYSEKWSTLYPTFGAAFAWSLYNCSLWPTTRHPMPDVDASDSSAPILVVGTVNDPATPYEGAISLTEDLGGETGLLTYDGDGHTAYPSTDCVNAAVLDYLVNLTMPPDGTVCPK